MEERDRLRLINLTSLFDSPVEGERLNALSAANRLLERNKLRWRDINRVLGGAEPPPRQRAYSQPPRPPDRDEIGEKRAKELMAWLASLVTREGGAKVSAWEADFCNDIYDRLEESGGRTRITERQWEVIKRIKKKNGDA